MQTVKNSLKMQIKNQCQVSEQRQTVCIYLTLIISKVLKVKLLIRHYHYYHYYY